MTQPGMWSSGDAYEAYMGGWSRLIAPEFLAWLKPANGLEWLDVGCGTGALSATILESAAPMRLVGVDPSPEFVEHATKTIGNERASFRVGDAQSLPADVGVVDCAVSGLVLNFVPDTGQALREMMRVVRPGGVVAAYVWDYADGMRFLRYFWDAATALDEAAIPLDEGRKESICNPEALRALFESRFTDVETAGLVAERRFGSFDEYWAPFTAGIGPAPAYVATLDESRRKALRSAVEERITRELGVEPVVSVKAWGVKSRKAGG